MARLSAPSPFAPRVHVRWADGVSDSTRAELERRFALREGRQRQGSTWEYDLTVISLAAVRQLIDDPAVADTHYLDRGNGQVADDAPPGKTRLDERWVAGWINSSLFDWFMLFWASSVVVCGVWLTSAANRQRQ
jgi:hypothetical protein